MDRVEVVGLDEAYMDLSGLERPRAAARQVKAAITDETGIGCSIGVGPNKLVAKVASDADKPDGFLVLTRDEACERFAAASPGLIPGIGPKTRERLEGHGITTLRPARLRARRAASPSGSAAPRARTSAVWPGSRTSGRWRR